MTETTPPPPPRGPARTMPPDPNNLPSTPSPTTASFPSAGSSLTTTGSPAATASVAPKVVKPIMGGILVYEDGKEVAYVGGAPNANWTGLEVAPTSCDNPNLIRSIHAYHSLKGQQVRVSGLDDKLNV